MLREFPYLTTVQEDVSVGSLVALKFCQICLDHIAIITRQIAECRSLLDAARHVPALDSILDFSPGARLDTFPRKEPIYAAT